MKKASFQIILIAELLFDLVQLQSTSRTAQCSPFRPITPLILSRSQRCVNSSLRFQGESSGDQDRTVAEVIQFYGYNLETHALTSEDGYISTIYRISGSPLSPPAPGKQAVLIFHGLGGGSGTWVIQYGDRNLAFKLADAGYEVWLANARGTKLSMNHTSYNADLDLSYWNFGMDEIAIRDLPLMIDFILAETGNEKIHYVCHSIGCALYAIGISELPSLNDKLKSGILLAPALYGGHGYSSATALLNPIVGTSLQDLLFRVLRGRIDVSPNLFRQLRIRPERFCTLSAFRCGICNNLLFAIQGFDEQQLNYTNLPNIISKLGDNIPLNLAFHFVQNYRTCSFRKFDYGAQRNQMEYGFTQPPAYDLSQIKVPTYIFYGESDNIVTPLDALRTRDALPSDTVKGFFKVEWSLFTHIDFLMAQDADILVYNRILSIITEIDNEPLLK